VHAKLYKKLTNLSTFSFTFIVGVPLKGITILAHGIFCCELYLNNTSLHCRLLRIIVRNPFGDFPLEEASELSFL
jgi:hypothetical protein